MQLLRKEPRKNAFEYFFVKHLFYAIKWIPQSQWMVVISGEMCAIFFNDWRVTFVFRIVIWCGLHNNVYIKIMFFFYSIWKKIYIKYEERWGNMHNFSSFSIILNLAHVFFPVFNFVPLWFWVWHPWSTV